MQISARAAARAFEGAAPVAATVVGVMTSAQIRQLSGGYAGGNAMVRMYGTECFRPGGAMVGAQASRLLAGGARCSPRCSARRALPREPPRRAGLRRSLRCPKGLALTSKHVVFILTLNKQHYLNDFNLPSNILNINLWYRWTGRMGTTVGQCNTI